MGIMSDDISSLRTQRLQRAYNWEMIMPTLLPITGDMVSGLVQSVSYSDYEMTDPAVLRDGAFQRFFANHLKVNSFKITFLETETAIVKLYMSSWKDAMLDRNGLYKAKIGGYARDISLLYLTSEGNPIREVKFQNSFPLQFYAAELNYSSNEVVKITIPFICDRIMEGIPGFTGILSSPFMGKNIGAGLSVNPQVG